MVQLRAGTAWVDFFWVNHLFKPHSLVWPLHAIWGIWNYLHTFFFLTLWCPKLMLFVVASFKSLWRSSDALADCVWKALRNAMHYSFIAWNSKSRHTVSEVIFTPFSVQQSCKVYLKKIFFFFSSGLVGGCCLRFKGFSVFQIFIDVMYGHKKLNNIYLNKYQNT